jgi:hypothetical protein
MLFRVYRTSGWGSEEAKPCENAVFDNDEQEWIIEINSLEELLKLAQELDKQIIITPKKYKNIGNELPFLEIYDAWRE